MRRRPRPLRRNRGYGSGMTKRPKVTVLGSLNMDISVTVPRLPGPGATVLGSAARFSPGGKGANQAVAAARLGADVRMVGCVGDDDFGRQLLAALRAEGIDADAVRIVTGLPTGLAMIAVDQRREPHHRRPRRQPPGRPARRRRPPRTAATSWSSAPRSLPPRSPRPWPSRRPAILQPRPGPAERGRPRRHRRRAPGLAGRQRIRSRRRPGPPSGLARPPWPPPS